MAGIESFNAATASAIVLFVCAGGPVIVPDPTRRICVSMRVLPPNESSTRLLGKWKEGMEWNGRNGMEWNGRKKEWNGMEWNGMEWNDRMEWKQTDGTI